MTVVEARVRVLKGRQVVVLEYEKEMEIGGQMRCC